MVLFITIRSFVTDAIVTVYNHAIGPCNLFLKCNLFHHISSHTCVGARLAINSPVTINLFLASYYNQLNIITKYQIIMFINNIMCVKSSNISY